MGSARRIPSRLARWNPHDGHGQPLLSTFDSGTVCWRQPGQRSTTPPRLVRAVLALERGDVLDEDNSDAPRRLGALRSGRPPLLSGSEKASGVERFAREWEVRLVDRATAKERLGGFSRDPWLRFFSVAQGGFKDASSEGAVTACVLVETRGECGLLLPGNPAIG